MIEAPPAGQRLTGVSSTDVESPASGEARVSVEAAEANAKFRTMFEQGTQFAGILSTDGAVLEANHLCLDGCGFTREQVLGRPFWECPWWNRSAELMARIRGISLEAAAGRQTRTETDYFVADGSERMVDLVLAPVRDDAGRILFLAATGTDITDRKRAERELRLRDERLALLVENTTDYAVIICDHRNMVVEWQGGAEAITGYRAEEAQGCNADLIFTEEDRARGIPEQELTTAIGTGRVQHKRWHVRKDGSPFFADGVTTALYDEEGRLRGFGKVFRDATVQKRAEEALQKSEDRLRLLDALGEATRSASDPSAVMAVTARRVGEYLRVTRCAYADVEADNDRFHIRDDWTVEGAVSTVGTYTLDRFGARAAIELRRGQTLVVRDVEGELAEEDGAAMFRALGIKAIICCPLVKESRLVALMAVHQSSPRDWTAQDVALLQEVVERSWAHIERIRAAEQLREQDRRKDEFLATLAHELRNPLAPIRTGLEVMKRWPSGPDAAKAREMMDRQLGHMVRLIDDLLDISRINRGKFELRRDLVQLASVIEHAVEASRPLIEAARHDLVVDLPKQPVWLRADLTRLAQVVSNLLNNSAKYTEPGGRITLSAAVEPGVAVIHVIDNGSGMSPEMLPQVFELFTQLNRTLSQAQGGLGIGLSLVRRLVEMHGGTVEARSAGIGKGSTFTVRIPLELSRAEAPDVAAHERTPGRDVGLPATRRILVVDDNQDGAEMLATMLDLTGHQTRTAHDGPNALSAAREFLPQVVFLDIGMPGMDGYEVAKRMRADPELGDAVLVALTGWGSAEDKRRTKDAGFDFHLTKPVEGDVVEDLLARL